MKKNNMKTSVHNANIYKRNERLNMAPVAFGYAPKQK